MIYGIKNGKKIFNNITKSKCDKIVINGNEFNTKGKHYRLFCNIINTSNREFINKYILEIDGERHVIEC